MNTTRIAIAMSVVAFFVFSSWLPVEADEGEMFELPVLSGMYKASDFKAENRENSEKWDCPESMICDDFQCVEEACRPTGDPCEVDNQCCSNTCAISASDDIGECISN